MPFRFPHRFHKETFGNKKPSKEARKGTFEGFFESDVNEIAKSRYHQITR